MAYSYKLWTLEEELKLQELVKSKKYSYNKIGTFLNRSGSSCISHARFLGLHNKFKSAKKYSVDETFWSSPNLINSYWAGFLAADGGIDKKSDNQCNIRVEISILDEEHLKRFRQDCGYDGPIHRRIREKQPERTPTDTISISSSQWGADLEKNFNIIQNKTKRLQPPVSILNDFDLSLAYLVGYTDGDGTIHLLKGKEIPYISWTSCSLSIIEWVYNFIESNFPKTRKRKGKISKFQNYYKASFGGTITHQIKKAMLPLSLPYLHRKWDKIVLPNENMSISDEIIPSDDKIQQTTLSEVNPSTSPV